MVEGYPVPAVQMGGAWNKINPTGRWIIKLSTISYEIRDLYNFFNSYNSYNNQGDGKV